MFTKHFPTTFTHRSHRGTPMVIGAQWMPGWVTLHDMDFMCRRLCAGYHSTSRCDNAAGRWLWRVAGTPPRILLVKMAKCSTTHSSTIKMASRTLRERSFQVPVLGYSQVPIWPSPHWRWRREIFFSKGWLLDFQWTIGSIFESPEASLIVLWSLLQHCRR